LDANSVLIIPPPKFPTEAVVVAVLVVVVLAFVIPVAAVVVLVAALETLRLAFRLPQLLLLREFATVLLLPVAAPVSPFRLYSLLDRGV